MMTECNSNSTCFVCNALSGTFDSEELMGCQARGGLSTENRETTSVTSRVHKGEISFGRDLL